MKEIGDRPEGVLRTVRDAACCMTSVYLNDELVGIVSDLQMMRMPRDGVAIDWRAWAAAKLTDSEHRREEEP